MINRHIGQKRGKNMEIGSYEWMDQNYSEIRNEVREIRDYLNKKMEIGSREEDLYKGTAILYSNYVFKPDIMFIGINPNGGFYNQTKQKYQENELDPVDCLEYLEDYGGNLSNNTVDIFSKTKYFEKLGTAVKTNLFYTATNNQNELYEFMGIINEKYNINYQELSQKWTRKIIDIFKPRTIICEGKKVLDNICDLYNCDFEYLDNIGISKTQNMNIIGYSRLYSHIKNPSGLINAINNLDLD